MEILTGKQFLDNTIPKEKLNLVTPTLDKDPVTKEYLEDLNYQESIDGLRDYIDKSLGLIDELTAITYPDLQPTWVNVLSSAVATNGAGATTSAANKTITILSGNTGIGAGLSQFINISQFSSYEVGDEVIIRLLVLESTFGVLESSVVSMKSNAVSVEISPTVISFGDNSLLFEIKFPYIIASKTETLEIKFSVKSDATVLPTNGVLTWNSLSIFNLKDRYEDTIRAASKSLKNADLLYTFFERSPVISQINITNSSDNTARFQDELDKAVQTSGELYLPRNANALFKNTVYINGGVRIVGRGSLLNPDFLSVGELFNINTADPVILEGFSIWRLNGSSLATSVKFNPVFINKDSQFKNVLFANFPEALNIDYTENLEVLSCIFGAGQNAIRLGLVAPDSVKNTTIEKCRFESVNTISIDARSANDLHIVRNIFKMGSGSSTFNARDIVVAVTDATSTGLRIVNNNFEAFREYAIRLATGGTGILEDTVISNNVLKDRYTAALHSGCIYVTGTAVDSIKSLTVENNIIHNKRTAIDITNAQYLHVNNNTIVKESTGASDARAFRLVGCSDPKVLVGNLKSLDQAADIIS